MQEIKYIDEELVQAIERLEERFEFDKTVDASRKAGEIINNSLDRFEKSVDQELMRTEPDNSSQDKTFSEDRFEL